MIEKRTVRYKFDFGKILCFFHHIDTKNTENINNSPYANLFLAIEDGDSIKPRA